MNQVKCEECGKEIRMETAQEYQGMFFCPEGRIIRGRACRYVSPEAATDWREEGNRWYERGIY